MSVRDEPREFGAKKKKPISVKTFSCQTLLIFRKDERRTKATSPMEATYFGLLEARSSALQVSLIPMDCHLE